MTTPSKNRAAEVDPRGVFTMPASVRRQLGVHLDGAVVFRALNASGGVSATALGADAMGDVNIVPYLHMLQDDLPSQRRIVLPLSDCLDGPVSKWLTPAEEQDRRWRLMVHPVLALQFERSKAAAGRTSPGAKRKSHDIVCGYLLRKIPSSVDLGQDLHMPVLFAPGWFRATIGRHHIYFFVDRLTRTIVYAWVAARQAVRLCTAHEPYVLLDSICTVAMHGRLILPKWARRTLGVQSGGWIAFRAKSGVVTLNGLPPRRDPIPVVPAGRAELADAARALAMPGFRSQPDPGFAGFPAPTTDMGVG